GGIIADLRSGVVSGNGYGGADQVANFQVIYGGPGNDFIIGTNGNDTLHGGTGDDQFTGGSGADTFYGDAGSNTVRYDTFLNGAMTASLSTPSINTGDAFGDAYVNIQNMIGSPG